ncbi:traB domain-containing protein [Dendroctonus ponderosae]|uniref:TraB domain-containing protein n=1 Tax=Dendroctonus ponderosae TaxID=77166 RepID=U4USW7_DENPD|nr:traB domain-containing protein [Dendroctonus ponderosae]ERL93200.1 hypothetical protein D910_10497 [Dendroctonus ponderosae]KAH1024540.1 hypothetical protein HUJ05_004005 [Dendroctonus ponderosae]
MENSLSNFELTDSALLANSENGSDKSDGIEILGYGDVEPSSSNKSVDGFELPDTVTLLTHPETGANVYLVGTAHFSKESQEDVKKVIRHVQPQVIIVELCPSRTSMLALDEKTVLEEAKTIDMARIISTIRSNGALNGAMYLLLLNMSAHITKEIGMAPGGEFRVAYQEALNIPFCSVHLGDRPIGITIRRALAKLTWFQTIKLAWHLLTTNDPISTEEIERCKNRDMLEQLLAELAGDYPAFREVFLDERDIYLTNTLQIAAALKPADRAGHDPDVPLNIVAVIGIGHSPGIIKLWPVEQKQFIAEIMKIPPRSLSSKIVALSFKLSLIGLGGYLIYKYVPVPKVAKSHLHLFIEKVAPKLQTFV